MKLCLAIWVVVAGAVVVMMVSGAQMESGSLPPMTSSHRVVLDQTEDYHLLWTPREEDVVFEVQVRTKGYVGLGFSPNGGMKGADIILGWVVDGQVLLHDRYADGYSLPTIDQSQDVELLGGYENNTHTVLRFSRPWITCDQENDMELASDTLRVIWAVSNQDSPDEASNPYHSQRGTKSLYLKDPQFTAPELTSDVKSWDILAGNIAVPDNVDTVYWCKLFKIPTLTQKVHVIGYIPLVEEQNAEHVHHLVLYECHIPEASRYYDKWLEQEQGAQCHTKNMPGSWKFCSKTFIAWAVGGAGENFPEHAGFPIGEEYGSTNYFMMEMHYDNPNLRSGVVDNSGVRLFYTEKLRKYDAGVMLVGHTVSPLLIVPPNQENWLTNGYCHSSCTQKHLPQEGIQFFQGLLHSHVLGSSLSLRHIRGNTELPVIMKDETYDFNFQQSRVLRDEVTVLPGDTLLVECSYQSKNRNNPTFGGLGTPEEMCMGFMSYYPAVKLINCLSEPLTTAIVESLGVEELYNNNIDVGNLIARGHQLDEERENALYDQIVNGNAPVAEEVKLEMIYGLLTAKAPPKYFNKTVYDILATPGTWEDPALTNRLQEAVTMGSHNAHCMTNNWISEPVSARMSTSEYPTFTPWSPVQKQCRAAQTASNSPSANSGSSSTSTGNTESSSTGNTQSSSTGNTQSSSTGNTQSSSTGNTQSSSTGNPQSSKPSKPQRPAGARPCLLGSCKPLPRPRN